MKVIPGCIHVMVVSGSVNDELNVVRPSKSGIQHLDLLSVLVMIRDGSIEHAEPRW